jgi:uncharacterized protein (DUF2267 family)
MSSDDDIPVLRDAVARRKTARFSQEQIDEICSKLTADAWVMLGSLLEDALQEAEDNLRIRINDRLSNEFPALIEKTLREKLADSDDE